MITHTQLAELERVVPAMLAVPLSLRSVVLAEASTMNADHGALLFDRDDRCFGYVALLGGAVRVVRPGRDGREIMLYRVRPGESCVLTTSCILGRTSYPARAVAEGAVAGIGIPSELFERLVAEVAPFRRFVFATFAERMGTLMRLVEEVAFHKLDQRIAAILVRLGSGSAGRILEVTHQRLADDVGSVREIVSRILESFESEGLVRLQRGRITVVDIERLQSIAGPLRD